MYEELVIRCRDNGMKLCGHMQTDFWNAADAIERLERRENDLEKLCAAWQKRYDGDRRWIPVTERCPEKSGDYLVFDDCRSLYVNEWHCLLKKWQYDDSRITHWMPLPEPPKGE